MVFTNKFEASISRGNMWTVDGMTYRIRDYVKYAKEWSSGNPIQYDLELLLVDPKEVSDPNCKEVHIRYEFYNLDDKKFIELYERNTRATA